MRISELYFQLSSHKRKNCRIELYNKVFSVKYFQYKVFNVEYGTIIWKKNAVEQVVSIQEKNMVLVVANVVSVLDLSRVKPDSPQHTLFFLSFR